MALLNRTELNERLSSNIVEVHFIKVNGEKRIMRCTTDPSLISECPVDRVDNNLPEDSGRVNVWDVDKQDWRAFLIERVITVMTPARSREDIRPAAKAPSWADRVADATSLKDIILNPKV